MRRQRPVKGGVKKAFLVMEKPNWERLPGGGKIGKDLQ